MVKPLSSNGSTAALMSSERPGLDLIWINHCLPKPCRAERGVAAVAAVVRLGERTARRGRIWGRKRGSRVSSMSVRQAAAIAIFSPSESLPREEVAPISLVA